MRIHHLNCATMCPLPAELVNGRGGYLTRGLMVCHCLLVETEQGLVLVDTGLGLADVADPVARLGRAFLAFTSPRLDPKETALRQVERLGFRAADVRHIVLTHMDVDHAGGLPDFPEARVHVYATEHEAAMAGRTLTERHRYRAVQWAHGPRFELYATRGEPWFGFECVRELAGLPPEVLLVPVVGHTRGHCAVAVDTGGGWLVHAGDAYFYHGEMHPERRRCPAGLEIFQRAVEMDARARRDNQERLRLLARDHSGEVRLFSAHDPIELDACREAAAGAPRSQPAPRQEAV